MAGWMVPTGPLAAEAAALVERLRQSVVVVASGRGHGSGVVWPDCGLIVTNDHVIGRRAVEVETFDGRRLAAEIVARDHENDLAALRVEARDLRAAEIGNSTELQVGQLVLAIGHPFGVRGSASLGIISGIGGVRTGRGGREMLQADVALAPGNSGGPIADAGGRVIGVACMVAGPGMALAVPSHVVQRFIERVTSCEPAWRRAA